MPINSYVFIFNERTDGQIEKILLSIPFFNLPQGAALPTGRLLYQLSYKGVCIFQCNLFIPFFLSFYQAINFIPELAFLKIFHKIL